MQTVYPLASTEDKVIGAVLDTIQARMFLPELQFQSILSLVKPQMSSNHNSPKLYKAPEPHGLVPTSGTTCESVSHTLPDLDGLRVLAKPSSCGHCNHSSFPGSLFL